jgi:heme/copper-type cytochrome/quinol oxidase subunit 4
MENKTIRIAVSSVLIYLIFKKLYNILTQLLLWLKVELRLENEYALIALNIVIGILSLLLLIFLYNRHLKKERLKNKTIYSLILIVVLLTIIFGGIIKLYGNYLVNTDIHDLRMSYLLQLGWSKILEKVFSIFGLIYFLWKLLKEKNIVTNTE